MHPRNPGAPVRVGRRSVCGSECPDHDDGSDIVASRQPRPTARLAVRSVRQFRTLLLRQDLLPDLHGNGGTVPCLPQLLLWNQV